MRIAINLLNFRPGRIGGAETYLRQLLAHLPAAAGDGERLISICDAGNADAVDVPGIERVVIPQSRLRTVCDRSLEAATPWRAKAVERIIDAAMPDVVFYPQQSLFPKVCRWPSVLTVHDLQHRLYPRNFSLTERLFRKCIYGHSLRAAKRIIAISAFTKDSIIRLYNIPSSTIEVVYSGFAPVPCRTIEPWENSPRPYLYYPAATYQHKGHIALLRTMGNLVADGGFPFRLVLSGQRTTHWREIQRVIHECRLVDQVEHLGFLEYGQVLGLYKSAAAVVFPTEFEGFGLPAVEAASMGKKVIVSRLSTFDEIGIPPECQIDFREADQLRNALADLKPTVLSRQPISWHQTASQTLQVLRTAAGQETEPCPPDHTIEESSDHTPITVKHRIP